MQGQQQAEAVVLQPAAEAIATTVAYTRGIRSSAGVKSPSLLQLVALG